MKTAAYYRAYRKARAKRFYRKHSKWNRDYRHRNPDRASAWSLVNHYIRYGAIKKPKRCEDCRRPARVQAHHPDYSIPLCIVWLCRKCHAAHHKRLELRKRA